MTNSKESTSNQTKNNQLKEGIDYTVNPDGNLVFTRSFLLKRGWCCTSGCQNCPYECSKSIDPTVPQEFIDRWSED